MTYTLQQLIDEWKLRRGLEPVRSDAAFHRFDALDIDTYIGRLVDKWYHSLLDSGPDTALIAHDIAPQLIPVSHAATKAVYRLPDGCRRLLQVDVDVSLPPAVIAEPGSTLARSQECPFARGKGGAPVAVRYGDLLHVYSFTTLPDAPPDRVLAIVTPPEGIYELSAEGLDSIADILS
ncbi:MAG: hypothetical protein K2I64_04310 [Muribaculaceae bacterium]|nr:hypothetical protein [Muribaculaceae bacterium]